MTNPMAPTGALAVDTVRMDPTSAPPAKHEYDEVCQRGEETASKALIDDRGYITVVHGPREQLEALRCWNDLASVPEIKSIAVHLPTRPGRRALEETRRRAEEENPGALVSVDCYGRCLIIPPGAHGLSAT